MVCMQETFLCNDVHYKLFFYYFPDVLVFVLKKCPEKNCTQVRKYLCKFFHPVIFFVSKMQEKKLLVYPYKTEVQRLF